MYERLLVNFKIERGSTFTFTRDHPYIASILPITLEKFMCARTWKLLDSGNPLSVSIPQMVTAFCLRYFL